MFEPGKTSKNDLSEPKFSSVRLVLRAIRLLSPRERLKFYVLLGARVGVQFFELLGLAGIGLLGSLIANGLRNDSSVTFLGIELPTISESLFIALVISVTALFILKSATSAILLRVSTRFFAKIEASRGAQILGHIFGGNLSRLNRWSPSEINWLATAGIRHSFTSTLTAGTAIIAEGSLFILVFVMFFAVDPGTATAITIFFGLLALTFQLLISRRLQRTGRLDQLRTIELGNLIIGLVDAYREALVLGRRRNLVSKAVERREQLAFLSSSLQFLSGLPRYLIESSLMLGVAVLVVLQFLAENPASGIPTVGVFLAGGFRMIGAILPLQSAAANLRVTSSQARKAHELLAQAASEDTKAEISSYQIDFPNYPLGVAPRPPSGPSIVLEKVSFQYPNAKGSQINDASLNIKSGEKIAIIGESGAGKSTLVDLIMGVIDPDAGSVEMLPPTGTGISESEPLKVAYVPQKPGIVLGTLRENVALGIPPEVINDSRILELIERLDLSSLLEQFPDGLDTELNGRQAALSGGQLQRIGIARALYFLPDLLILDEPTSALDASTEDRVSREIHNSLPGSTVITVAHRLSTVQHSDRVYLVEEGRIRASGTLPELIKSEPTVKKYVELMKIKGQ